MAKRPINVDKLSLEEMRSLQERLSLAINYEIEKQNRQMEIEESFLDAAIVDAERRNPTTPVTDFDSVIELTKKKAKTPYMGVEGIIVSDVDAQIERMMRLITYGVLQGINRTHMVVMGTLDDNRVAGAVKDHVKLKNIHATVFGNCISVDWSEVGQGLLAKERLTAHMMFGDGLRIAPDALEDIIGFTPTKTELPIDDYKLVFHALEWCVVKNKPTGVAGLFDHLPNQANDINQGYVGGKMEDLKGASINYTDADATISIK